MEGAIQVEFNRTIHPSSVVRARYAPGRIVLPVAGGVFARFEHISAVPAPAGTPGYSVSRIRAINALIERLDRLGESSPFTESGVVGGEAAQVAMARMAETIQDRIRHTPAPYAPGYELRDIEEGLVVSAEA